MRTVRFSESLTNYRSWLRHAEALIAGAQVLEAEISRFWSECVFHDGTVVQQSSRTPVWNAHAILAAYALENLLKGLLIWRERDALQRRTTDELPRHLKTHDLVKLAAKAGISLSLVEEDLLQRLSFNSEWAGRYPVPTKAAKDVNMKRYSDGSVRFLAYAHQRDPERLNAFVDRLKLLIKSEMGEDAA